MGTRSPTGTAGDTRLDLATAIKVGALQLVGTFFAARGQEGEDLRRFGVISVLLLALAAAALVFRRRRPVEVLAFVMAATLTYYVVDFPYGPAFVALVVAFYTAVTRGHRVAAAVVATTGYVGYLVLESRFGPEGGPSLAHAGALAAWLLVVLVGSEVFRVRRERAVEEARTRAEEARRKASEERLRIARELHDVVAHNISLINVQAGVALHLIDQQPEQARTALAAIKQASKEALAELRSVLDVLRQVDEQEPRAPAPGLRDVETLVSRAGAAGLDVRVEISGTAHPLPPGVDLAAYRIVQEALTNVVRHAGPAAATVRVAYGDGGVAVQVEDDGRGLTSDSSSSGGKGLAGMRERVASLGGRFEAGPRAEGGFRVRAELPLSPRNEPSRS
ncbi:MAG: sensor histidine kinase [Actinomycetota bacterium]|nr:sensor histidine kinase [Actinomycetota bacterium]